MDEEDKEKKTKCKGVIPQGLSPRGTSIACSLKRGLTLRSIPLLLFFNQFTPDIFQIYCGILRFRPRRICQRNMVGPDF